MEPTKAATRVSEPTVWKDRYALMNSAQRLQDMAAFLASEGLEEAARCCSAAVGAIRAKLAADKAA